jgi:hypothetical protein
VKTGQKVKILIAYFSQTGNTAQVARAIYFDDPSYRRIKAILNAALDREPLPEGIPAVFVPKHVFARSGTEFFADGEEVDAC